MSRDRHPDQLTFEKKSNERGVPVKCAKEREDVDPRNVIADDEVVAVVAKSVDAFDVPLGREHPIEDPVVAGNPMLREFRKHEHDPPPHFAARDEFSEPDDEHRRAPQNQIADEQKEAHMIAQVSLPPIEDDPRFADAITLFNSGDYFEASDIFEELFFEAVRDEVPVARALLQASVGLLHAERGQKQSAIGRLEEAKQGLRVTKNIGRADEAAHRPPHR